MALILSRHDGEGVVLMTADGPVTIRWQRKRGESHGVLWVEAPASVGIRREETGTRDAALAMELAQKKRRG